MLKRPSSRRKTRSSVVALNLVPILDTLVTLVAFLLFTMTFLALVQIESPFPQASTEESEQHLKENPLQLTLTIRETEVEIWSPFDVIPSARISNPSIGMPDLRAIHEALLGIKQRFPNESKVVIVPHASTTYDTLVSIMDTSRLITPTDPPIYRRNPATGNDELVKALFPQIIFGNLLGTGSES